MNQFTTFTAATILTGAMAMITPSTVEAGDNAAALQTGRYFRYVIPEGWRANETTNGVDLTTPDGEAGASMALLVNHRQRMTPQSFLQTIRPFLAQSMTALQVSPMRPSTSANRTASETECDVRFIAGGRPVVGTLRLDVENSWGRSIGVMIITYAPADEWTRARNFLDRLGRSVAVSNPREVAGLNTLLIPGNNPNTAHDVIIAAGEARNRSRDYTNRNFSDATRGTTNMIDSTGRVRTVPQAAYDGTIGGYQDPTQPRGVLMTPANRPNRPW